MIRLKFKLYASFSEFLPTGAERNAVNLELPDNSSPLSVLQQHGVPLAQVHLVLVNGVFVPPSARHLPLSDGDELAVWPAVAGG
ncbi:MAG: MoaD/ThiS family protein [Gammaproteobacteria bacterium]|nr:MoaD/ThiS family protein [Gammaproteobacteria bacterium]MCP5416651.1 MoaD/ThiS family protein [Chromatiaceae bacterium]